MNYFILSGNQQQGPYTIDELRSRHISSDTLVWAEGMSQWTPAWQVAALRSLFVTAPQPVTPVTPDATPAPAGSTGPAGAGNADDTRESRHKKPRRRGGCTAMLTTIAIAAAIIVVVLAATCPTADKHREAVSAEISRIVEHASDSNSDAWGMLGNMIATQIVDVVIDNVLKVDNHLVYSVGRVHFKGKDKIVSVGILNHVFTFDADDVERALKNGSDSYDHFSTPSVQPGNDDEAGTPGSTPPTDTPDMPDEGPDDDGADEGTPM